MSILSWVCGCGLHWGLDTGASLIMRYGHDNAQRKHVTAWLWFVDTISAISPPRPLQGNALSLSRSTPHTSGEEETELEISSDLLLQADPRGHKSSFYLSPFTVWASVWRIGCSRMCVNVPAQLTSLEIFPFISKTLLMPCIFTSLLKSLSVFYCNSMATL